MGTWESFITLLPRKKVLIIHRVIILVGTRPEIIKMAPVIQTAHKNSKIEPIVIHSGQHYDYSMDKIFFEDLRLPPPNVNLNIGSGSHAEQTARMLVAYEKAFLEWKPDLVLSEGDTNTVSAAGLVCAKLSIPFGHVEAGIRSFDLTMPEEINRMIARVCASLHFAPSENAVRNLLYEGTPPEEIFLTGNTIVDATLDHIKIAKRKPLPKALLHLRNHDKPVIAVTAHRPKSVDIRENLESITRAFLELSECQIVFPVHPRAKRRLEEFNLLQRIQNKEHIVMLEPMGYLDFLHLLETSSVVLTDSGGVQEEALILQKSCVTMRNNTERPETVEVGANILVGTNSSKIVRAVRKAISSALGSQSKTRWPNPYGNGTAGEKIIQIVEKKLTKGLKRSEPKFIGAFGSFTFQAEIIETSSTVQQLEDAKNGRITLVYDVNGVPIKPHPDLVLESGSIVRYQFEPF